MAADLRSFIHDLERRGELVRVRTEVDPDQEITIIQHRVIAAGGPALLFERVKGSAFRLVSNLLGTPRRVALACGAPPAELGGQLGRIGHQLMAPSLPGLWRARGDLRKLTALRLRRVRRAPILDQCIEPADLNLLPVLTCWPEDGGPFFTLPLVHTTDPQTGSGNLGIYRMQRFDAGSTGMHWQIEKGGGFHFHAAAQMGKALPVSVILGGPPALVMAAVAPLPEGMDERLFAAFLMGRPLDVVHRTSTGHRIPAQAEFVLEGTVRPGELRMEGPFGDHFGHYSTAAEYPVFRVQRILARRGAIYPATVVGKPIQEDYFIGEALQELTLPLLRLIKPAVVDIWAYPETGFHPLAVLSVRQRYPREALKFTLGMLGEGQVSLTKVMITVDPEVNVRDFRAVSEAVWRHLAVEGMHLLTPTAQDTLDFTGPAMNTGSRLIMMATRVAEGPIRTGAPPAPPRPGELHPGVRAVSACGPAFLIVQVDDQLNDFQTLCETLRHHESAGRYLFHVVVGADVPLDDPVMLLWGWFTRFDPAADLYPSGRRIAGNRLLLDFPIAIDARWKKGYPRPVTFDPEVERRVEAKWKSYGIDND
jgi:4-hydroxybenzoate decarboxylase subunit C